MVRPCVTVLGLAAFACSVRFEAGAGFRCDDGVSCPAGQACVGGHCVDPAAGDGAGEVDAGGADVSLGLDPPWWDEAYALRRPLTITNLSQDVLRAGYELRWYDDFTPFTPPPFDPLRIVRWDGISWDEKDRVLDDFADMAQLEEQFFFDLDDDLAPGDSNHEYWLYYDNPGAGPAPSSPSRVFPIFYEGFNQSLDLAVWAVQGAPATLGSELVLAPGDSVRSLATWGPGFALDVKDRRPSAAGASWGGFQRSADFVNDSPWILWVDWDGDGALTPDSKLPAVNDVMSTSGPPVTPGPAARVYTIARLPDRIVYAFEGLVHDERVLPATDDELLQIRLHNGSTGTTLFFATVRIRRVVHPEPEIVLGDPEARP